jgi:hypothetical protein
MSTFKAAADGFKERADRIRELARNQKPETQKQYLVMAEEYKRHAEMLLETGRNTKR